jgi:hypothetical protein
VRSGGLGVPARTDVTFLMIWTFLTTIFAAILSRFGFTDAAGRIYTRVLYKVRSIETPGAILPPLVAATSLRALALIEKENSAAAQRVSDLLDLLEFIRDDPTQELFFKLSMNPKFSLVPVLASFYWLPIDDASRLLSRWSALYRVVEPEFFLTNEEIMDVMSDCLQDEGSASSELLQRKIRAKIRELYAGREVRL